MNKLLILIISLLAICTSIKANRHYDIVVAKDGTGDYASLTEAINNLPMYQFQRCVIFVKKGIYEEKIRIEQNNITLLGETRDSTIIRYSQLRSDWQEKKDFIGPAVINIHADDIILDNLTIENTQPLVGPHAFTVYGTGTRTIIVNCNVISKGGDTVSLWNYKNGMYYHSNCYFEGAVDFVCPRGWCYISESKFFELKETAAIWHAAPENANQKFVLKNCNFDGVKGFQLGRHHYEAMFFLINCSFSKSMADKPIYRVTSRDATKDRPYFFGDRHYYLNCSRESGNYLWHSDNLLVDPGIINSEWTFDKIWNPESTSPPVVKNYIIDGNNLFLEFNFLLTIRGKLLLKTHTGKLLEFKEGTGRDVLRFETQNPITRQDFKKPLSVISGQIVITQASVKERILDKTIDL